MITAAFTLDIGGFLSSLNKAKNALAQTFGGAAGGPASIAIAGVGTAFAGAATAIAAASKGMYDAMKEGQSLELLKDKTGVGVESLMTLKTAFIQAGLGADQVESSLAILQEKLVTSVQLGGEAAYEFKRLGLSAESLSKMSADKAMEKVSAALGNVKNSAEQAKLANDLLGVSGNKMAGIFMGGGIQQAQETLGQSAKLMAQNSGLFNAVAGLLESGSIKLQAFFIGMASEVSPSLIQVLQDLNSLDFTPVGVQLGKIVGFVYESFSNGKLAEAIAYGISYGIKKALNSAFSVMEKIITGTLAWIWAAIKAIFSKDYIMASFMGILGIAQQFMGILFSGMGDLLNYISAGLSKIPILGKQMPLTTGITKAAGDLLSNMGRGFTYRGLTNIESGDKLKEKIDEKIAKEVENAYDYAGGREYFKMTPQDFGLEALFNDLIESLKNRNKKTRAAFSSPEPQENQPAPMQRYFIEPIASELQKIGGGGGFAGASNFNVENPLLDQARQQKAAQDRSNEILLQIAANTGNWSGKEVQALLK